VADRNSPYDPAFAARLHSLGVVAPNPFLPPNQQQQPPSSSTAQQQPGQPSPPSMNPALLVLRKRADLQRMWDEQVADRRAGRLDERGGARFVDVAGLRRALTMRENGASDKDIMRQMGLSGEAVAGMGRAVKPVDVTGQGEWRVQEAER
jgi:hypothetical protein